MSSDIFAHAVSKTKPGSVNQPIFRIARRHGLVPLTDSVARKFLTRLSHILHLSPKLTFHDCRRSGATWAFHHGVPLHQIMHHGTWKSDAIWAYIQNVLTASSSVSQTFQSTYFYSLAVWWGFHLPLQSNLLTFHLTLTFVVPI